MFVVDTNVLIYGINSASPHHDQAREAIQGWIKTRTMFGLTWSIVYEFLRVVTHPRVLERPMRASRALAFLDALFDSRLVKILVPTPEHLQCLRESLDEVPNASGNMLHDLYVAVLMREHGIAAICTADTDFHKFPWLEPKSPFR